MDYEKKYNEALEIAKMINSGECVAIPDGWTTMELLFPELRESEDEKIVNWLIRLINTGGYRELESDPMPCLRGKMVSYLEKLKERVAFTDEFAEIERNNHEDEVKQDYSGLTDLERAIHRGFLCAGVENVPVGIIKETAQECHVQIKTAEHAENIGPLLESKTLYGHILEEDFTRKKPIYSQNEIIRRLVGMDETIRSIRTQWRPTDAQMDAHDNIASSFSPNNKEYDMVMENINSLREDLLKLKFPKI